jgi:hypothetical protein
MSFRFFLSGTARGRFSEKALAINLSQKEEGIMRTKSPFQFPGLFSGCSRLLGPMSAMAFDLDQYLPKTSIKY